MRVDLKLVSLLCIARQNNQESVKIINLCISYHVCITSSCPCKKYLVTNQVLKFRLTGKQFLKTGTYIQSNFFFFTVLLNCMYLSQWTFACLLSCACLFATSWTVALQALQLWNFPGKSIAVGCHFLLQGIFPT